MVYIGFSSFCSQVTKSWEGFFQQVVKPRWSFLKSFNHNWKSNKGQMVIRAVPFPWLFSWISCKFHNALSCQIRARRFFSFVFVIWLSTIAKDLYLCLSWKHLLLHSKHAILQLVLTLIFSCPSLLTAQSNPANWRSELSFFVPIVSYNWDNR